MKNLDSGITENLVTEKTKKKDITEKTSSISWLQTEAFSEVERDVFGRRERPFWVSTGAFSGFERDLFRCRQRPFQMSSEVFEASGIVCACFCTIEEGFGWTKR